MSNIARMMQRATAGAGGAGLDVDEVFSTFLYKGNSGTQSINNGLDLGPVRTEIFLTGKTITSLGSSFDGSYPLSNINDGVVETSNAQNIAYTSGTFDIYVDMGSAVIIDAYFLAPQGDQGGSTYNNPTGFTVSGSNNASSWTTIQTFSNITGFAAGALKTFEFTNTTTYRYYRLAVSNTGVSLSEWKVRTAEGTGEGGLVWIKGRTGSVDHAWYDTARGANSLRLSSSTTDSAVTVSGVDFSSFNSDGFTVKSGATYNYTNDNRAYVSWTFRKAPKFFDVVTYNGVDATQNISHNLGSVPGMMIVKRTNTTGTDWCVYHRSLDSNPENYFIKLQSTDAKESFSSWNNTAPTATQFTLKQSNPVNEGGGTYVAYLFAHNNNDGEFGPSGDQDIIKCGSYTGTGSEMFIDLGFEPQWILTRRTDTTDNWFMVDTMRGIVSDGGENYLWANTNNAEQATSAGWAVNPTGFTVESSSRYASGGTYIYVAIRRGPLAAPTDATKVFAIDTQVNQDPPLFDSGFPVDFALTRNVSSTADWAVGSRLIQGKQLNTNNTNAETSNPVNAFDFMDGWNNETLSTNSNVYSWMWKRAPGYFDVVAYTGTGSDPQNVSHNLGVVPEMIWARPRSYADHWSVFHKDLTYNLRTNDDSAMGTGQVFGTLTSSVMPATGGVNASGQTYIAYLFATVAGVSKLGSYTGNATDNHVIDCGFTSGARFVLIKKSSAPGEWFVVDTVRGIVAGADPFLELNQNRAQITGDDIVDPNSSGFALSSRADCNANGKTYIFYAIA